MVKVREDHPLEHLGEISREDWLQRIQDQVEISDPEKLASAFDLACNVEYEAIVADNIWSIGGSSFRMGLEMAQILAELKLDQASIISALVYRAVREGKVPLTTVKDMFGQEIADLIDSVLQMAAISSLHQPSSEPVLGQQQLQIDHLRKMLVSIIDDVRVALIKLAERTSAIRAVKNEPEDKKRRVAREVFDIYAPLAHRLGIGHIKWELEDLSFRYLEPVHYKKIAKQLAERRLDRQDYIGNVVTTLKSALESAGIQPDISGRAKHIYSIWRKMQRKNIDFTQVYDIRAVRILVPEIKDCYAALGIVHAFWRHIPNEFDDYIASPKENGYRSLHTAVLGPEGKVLEIQIRTPEMHEDAELGVCAHWLYKGTDTNTKQDSYEAKIAWLRQVLDWQEELGDISGLVAQLSTDVAADRIYVFTPDGHVVDLPAGASPLDFAYRVHTEIGHRCRGAKVNGRIVPLNFELHTGQQIEILTAKEGGPSRDWLNSGLGYLRAPRSRAKVQHWFKMQAREQNVIDGQVLVKKSLERMDLASVAMPKLVEGLGFSELDDLYVSVGTGDLSCDVVIRQAQKILEPVYKDDQLSLLLSENRDEPSPIIKTDDVQVRGVGRLMSQMANCCQPVPGDSIVGYITLGRGVSIHRQDCVNALQLEEREPNRIIEVQWGAQPKQVYPVNVSIKAYDRTGLLRDITTVLANEKVNVLSINTASNSLDSTADMTLSLEISGVETLNRLFNRLNQLQNVMSVNRRRDGV